MLDHPWADLLEIMCKVNFCVSAVRVVRRPEWLVRVRNHRPEHHVAFSLRRGSGRTGPDFLGNGRSQLLGRDGVLSPYFRGWHATSPQKLGSTVTEKVRSRAAA